MTQRDAFDELADRFGDDLDRAAQAHPASAGLGARLRSAGHAAFDGRWFSSRTVRTRRVAGAGAGLALAGTAAALVIGIGGGKHLDVISEARAAVAPGPYILHIRTETLWPAQAFGGATGMTTINDAWSATDPARWRVAQSFTDDQMRRGGPNDLPPKAAPEEFAYADGAQSTYDPGANIMTVITGFSPTGVASRPPDAIGVLGDAGDGSGTDPLEAIRTLLGQGDVRDSGPAKVDGHDVRRLIGTIPGSKNVPELKVEADVDAAIFAPVRLQYAPTGRGLHQYSAGLRTIMALGTSVVHFAAYERLPITPANEALLTIHPRPGVKITTTPHDQLVPLSRRPKCRHVDNRSTCRAPTK